MCEDGGGWSHFVSWARLPKENVVLNIRPTLYVIVSSHLVGNRREQLQTGVIKSLLAMLLIVICICVL